MTAWPPFLEPGPVLGPWESPETELTPSSHVGFRKNPFPVLCFHPLMVQFYMKRGLSFENDCRKKKDWGNDSI